MPTRIDADLPRHLMGIWPHPDDEAYLSAGLMARMADAGRSRDGAHPHPRREGHIGSGRLRPAPLRRPPRAASSVPASPSSASTTSRVLDYRDGECDLVDPEAAISRIAEHIDVAPPRPGDHVRT